MKEPNYLSSLAGSGMDRMGPRRNDERFVEGKWSEATTRLLPVWRSKHPVRQGNPPKLVFAEQAPPSLEGFEQHKVLLGCCESNAYFAVDVSELEDPARVFGFEESTQFLGLRELGALVSQEQGAMLAYASGMMEWHRRHQFCGTCGASTRVEQAGHVRRCVADACQHVHFPRTDPAVIVLVSDGDECLLGRQKSWPESVFSTLAGFVEPGESLEEAVYREVEEETGVEISGIEYHSSQPWPFPSSLMLGFTAQALSRDISLQKDELEDARWFHKEQLHAQDRVKLPSSISIARRLIEDWLN